MGCVYYRFLRLLPLLRLLQSHQVATVSQTAFLKRLADTVIVEIMETLLETSILRVDKFTDTFTFMLPLMSKYWRTLIINLFVVSFAKFKQSLITLQSRGPARTCYQDPRKGRQAREHHLCEDSIAVGFCPDWSYPPWTRRAEEYSLRVASQV